jgi:uncharacterized protein (TIGR03437 family)
LHTRSTALVLCLASGLYGASYRVENVAGGGAGGDGGPVAAARFLALEGVASGGDGSVYLADAAENRLRRVDPAGMIRAFAPSADLKNPYGLAVDRAGNVYVADYGNGRVRKIAFDGVVSDVATGLKGPRNVAVSSAGTLYISDFDGGKVYELVPGGKPVALGIAGLGSPAGLATDASGALYVADVSGGVVWRYLAGKAEIWIRNLDTPTGVAFGANSTLYVTGARFHFTMARVSSGEVLAAGPAARELASDGAGGVWMAAGTQLLRLRGTGASEVVAGSDAAASPVTLARDALLNGPIAIATDTRGNLFIAEEGAAKIRRVDNAGVINSLGEQTGIADPVAVAPTPSGGVLIAEFGPKRVRAIGSNGTASTLLTSASVVAPRAIVMDPLGNWYVADAGASRVLRIAVSGAVTALGQGFLVRPSGLALDVAGGLLVADTARHLVRRYEISTGNWRTVAGTGTAGDTGDGGPATEALLNSPTGVAAGPDGSIYIADTFNHRVRRVGPDGVIETMVRAPEVDTPSSVAIGGAGEIYVADLGHHRVVRLVPVAEAAATPLPDETGVPPVTLVALHAATRLAGALAPRQLFTLGGAAWDGVDLFLDGHQTAFTTGGVAQELAYAVVPEMSAGVMKIEARRAGRTVGVGEAPIVARAPALFADTNGLALVSDTRGALRSVFAGSQVSFYGTGEGVEPGAVQLVLALLGKQETLELSYAGSAPGLQGVLQINARIPVLLAPGSYQLQLWVGDAKGNQMANVVIQ